MTLPCLEEKWIENPTVVLVGGVHAHRLVTGTKRQDDGVSVNGAIVCFHSRLHCPQTKQSHPPPPSNDLSFLLLWLLGRFCLLLCKIHSDV